MAPETAQAAPFEKYRRADARPVVYAETLYVEYKTIQIFVILYNV